MFHKTGQSYVVAEGQQVRLRCKSKGNVTIRRVDTMSNNRTVTYVNNSVLIEDGNGSNDFTSKRKNLNFTNDLTIRAVKKNFNGSHFWCVDMATFYPQSFALTVMSYPQTLCSYNLLNFFTDQLAEPLNVTCISDEGNPKISIFLHNTLVEINESSVHGIGYMTHRSVTFNSELDFMWNNNIFSSYVTQSSPKSSYNYSPICPFQPTKFLKSFTVNIDYSIETHREEFF